jgi:hypothetical protein
MKDVRFQIACTGLSEVLVLVHMYVYTNTFFWPLGYVFGGLLPEMSLCYISISSSRSFVFVHIVVHNVFLFYLYLNSNMYQAAFSTPCCHV